MRFVPHRILLLKTTGGRNDDRGRQLVGSRARTLNPSSISRTANNLITVQAAITIGAKLAASCSRAKAISGNKVTQS